MTEITPGEAIMKILTTNRIDWDDHADLIRSQIQETGKVRLTFLTLYDLTSAINDLGINSKTVRFKDDYAFVEDE